MKRILMISVMVGLAIIAFLGGAVIYQVNKIKKQVQITLNQSLKDYSSRLEERGISLYYSPFECEGLLHIRCDSSKAVFLSENTLIFSLSDLFLALKDVDMQSINADFGFGVDDVQAEQDIEDYVEMLMPKIVRGSVKLTLQSKTDLLTETKIDLNAKNLDYKVSFDSKLTSENFKDKGVVKNLLAYLSGEPTRFIKMDVECLAKDLSPALFEVIKKQHGEGISFQDYEALLGFMIAIGKEQFSNSQTIRQLLSGVGELALGKKQQLKLSFTSQEEVCLNCRPLMIDNLKAIIEQTDITISTQ